MLISDSLVNHLNSFKSPHLLVMFRLEIKQTGVLWLQITSITKILVLFYAYSLLKNNVLTMNYSLPRGSRNEPQL